MTASVVPAAATAAPTAPATPPEPAQEPAVTPPAAADQGGEGKEPAKDTAKTNPEPPATGSEDEPLGPQGTKALEAWKTRAREAETSDRAKDTTIAELQAKLADVDKSPEEQALAAARREGATEATATVTTAATKALATQALLTEAKGRLADPSDVAAFLNAGDFKVGTDFTIDSAAITAAVDDLLQRKPHLAVKEAKPVPVIPAGSIDQGVRAKDGPSLADRIALAASEGRPKDSLRLKSQQLIELQAAGKKASGA